MHNKDIIASQYKFISPKHKAYSENVVFEILDSQEEAQYRLQNVIKMQVSNLQLALQICRSSQVESELEIFSLNEADSTILKEIEKKMQESKNSSTQNSFHIQSLKDTKEILDLNAVIVELASLLNNKDKKEGDIERLFNQVKEKLDFHKEKSMIFNDISDYDFSHTKKVFTQARETLNKIYNSLDETTQESKEDFKNRFNKDIIHLSAQIISTTHLPALAHILRNKLGASMATRLLLSMIGVALGPFAIAVSIILLLWDIYDFFSNKKQENKKLEASYKLYGAILSIYESLDYSLTSLLNFKHIGVGNLITTQRDQFCTYYLYSDRIQFHSTFLYPFLKNKAFNFEDMAYKMTLSLSTEKEPNQAYIQNIFKQDNKNDESHFIYTKKRTQFSTFSFEHLYKICEANKDNNFTHSSAFQHLQSMFLKFDSFLFIKSSSFSSILANDLLMQSYTPSKQQNKPRVNKTAIFLTNCIHNGLPEYQAQNHIKNELYSNENTKPNVLFLSAMYRIKKASFIRELINNLTKLFTKLGNCVYHNQTQQIHYLIRNLGWLIKKYNAGEVEIYGYGGYIKTYTINDKKICDMSERDFCNFVFDLCQVFVYKKYMQVCDDYKGSVLISKNDQKKLSQTKADIQKICEDIMAVILDVSCLFSHFNSYEITKLREYQEEIEKEYKKQRDMLEKFFSMEFFESGTDKKQVPNIFYNIKTIEELCLALLDVYFDIKGSNERLKELLKGEIQPSKAEFFLQKTDKAAYHQITIEYISSLLPLNESFLNCLEEEYLFLFARLIIEKLDIRKNEKEITNNVKKGEQKALMKDFIGNYEISIGLSTLIHSNDKDLEKLIDDNFKDKVAQEFTKAFYEISLKTGENFLEKELKKICDRYGAITALAFKDSTKNRIKTIAESIAKNLDEKYTGYSNSTKESKKLSLLSSFANSAISYIAQAILDAIFPVQIANVAQMKQQALALLFTLNRYRNTPYATCKQGSEYLTFPIEITQTLVDADLKAVIMGGSALDSGLFVHTPSVALFNEDSQNALRLLKETLRHFMNKKVNLIGIGEKGKYIVKEAYAKLWYYLDMGKNEDIESYLRNELQTKPSYYSLENLTSDKYIRAKLKKAKGLDNSDENFIEVEGNAKGGIKFNRDFLIQLKRVAEYNYAVYRGLVSTEANENINKEQYEEDLGDTAAEKVDKSPDEYLCGNLIYDEDYIPTTIDIAD